MIVQISFINFIKFVLNYISYQTCLCDSVKAAKSSMQGVEKVLSWNAAPFLGFQWWLIIWSNAVFFHRGPDSVAEQTAWCKSMGSNSKICFLPVIQCVAPALVYCILLSLAVKMKYCFRLGFSMTLITAVFVYFTCKLLINLSLWSPVRHGRSIDKEQRHRKSQVKNVN